MLLHTHNQFNSEFHLFEQFIRFIALLHWLVCFCVYFIVANTVIFTNEYMIEKETCMLVVEKSFQCMFICSTDRIHIKKIVIFWIHIAFYRDFCHLLKTQNYFWHIHSKKNENNCQTFSLNKFKHMSLLWYLFFTVFKKKIQINCIFFHVIELKLVFLFAPQNIK